MKSTDADLTQWNEMLRCAEASFDWCLHKAYRSRTLDKLDDALQWVSIAAWSAAGRGFFGKLAATNLELELEECAKRIELATYNGPSGERKRWLHVLDKAYVIGGHTAVCWRWIKTRAADECHSVMLLAQLDPVPAKLAAAVEASGGTIHVLEPQLKLVERARQLRLTACEHADVVVLHTHTDCVVPAIAFSRTDGPPVIVVNHADHAFQATAAIADLVFDIRESGQAWTKACRGIRATTIVPLPLLDELEGQELAQSEEAKMKARDELGLPKDGIILLTIGSAFKYNPIEGLSFQAAIEPVLMAHPQATLVAVGPEDDGEWRRLRKATGGRVLALGCRENLAAFHRSADIYIEGFPSGSLTAMLEAGLAGLPCVRAPYEVPPPFCSDGTIFASLPQPTSIHHYADQISDLITEPQERRRQGALMRANVRNHHCATNWVKALELGIKKLPLTHCINFNRKLNSISLNQRNYYLSLVHNAGTDPAKIGSAILSEATERGLTVHPADYSELGTLLQCGSTGTYTAKHRDSRDALAIARRLQYETQRRLKKRRMLAIWEQAKAGILLRLGIVSAARRLGRILIGDLRR